MTPRSFTTSATRSTRSAALKERTSFPDGCAVTSIVSVCREAGAISKVIFENCYLEKEEIRALAQIAAEVRPDFIKTSTGFGTGGALPEDVALMKETVGSKVRVKAAGGIRDWETCRKMIEAGAGRIGTSASIRILEGFRAAQNMQ